MPSPKRSTAKKRAAALNENSTPSEVIAHTILTAYSDLKPSVNKIMTAEMSEAGRLHAITLFQQSLSAQGDPMRDPANAIVAGQAVEEAESESV